MNNVFENPAFSMSALTAAINILPNNYGLMESMGLLAMRITSFTCTSANWLRSSAL